MPCNIRLQLWLVGTFILSPATVMRNSFPDLRISIVKQRFARNFQIETPWDEGWCGGQAFPEFEPDSHNDHRQICDGLSPCGKSWWLCPVSRSHISGRCTHLEVSCKSWDVLPCCVEKAPWNRLHMCRSGDFSEQNKIIKLLLAISSHFPGSWKVKFFCPIQVSYTVGQVLKNALRK